MVEIRKNLRLLLLCAALMCAVVGCRHSQKVATPGEPARVYTDDDLATIPPEEDEGALLTVMSPPAAEGDRYEIVIKRPDRDNPEQRIRAVVQTGGKMAVAGLGVFDAAGVTVRKLEQNLIDALNRDGTLKGTLRMTPAPIARSGLFLAAPIGEFADVVGDKTQLDQLDRNEHATWQWVNIDADLQRRLGSARQIFTIERDAQRVTLARPAHPELVNDRLAHNVASAWSQRGSQPTVTVELRPGAAMAMENVTRENLQRPLLIVIDNKVVLAPMIYTVMRDKLLLTDGIATLEPERQRQIAQLFNAKPRP